MRSRNIIVALALGSALAVSVLCCNDDPVPQPCSNIPAGGCPLSRGVACQDPACEAIYACRPNNVWEFQAKCEHEASVADPDASTTNPDASDADASSTTVIDAAVDAPPGAYGGPGCVLLQAPDCSLGLALSCGAGCCGCEDLFVCQNEEWVYWGFCGDAGAQPSP